MPRFLLHVTFIFFQCHNDKYFQHLIMKTQTKTKFGCVNITEFYWQGRKVSKVKLLQVVYRVLWRWTKRVCIMDRIMFYSTTNKGSHCLNFTATAWEIFILLKNCISQVKDYTPRQNVWPYLRLLFESIVKYEDVFLSWCISL